MLQVLNGIIKRKLNWLYADNVVKNLFSPGSIVYFWGVRKLSTYLVKTKVYPLERKIGSCGYGSLP